MKDLIEYLPFITEEAYLIGEKNGIPRETVYARWARNMWDIERAITEPVKKLKRSAEWQEWKHVCKEHGVYNELFYSRRKSGLPPELAATLKVEKRGGKRAIPNS